jgi:uncharacterized protein
VTNLLPSDGLAGCFRCGNVWRPRSAEPKICPRCKSRLWDVPRLRPVRSGRGLGIAEIIGPRRSQMLTLLHEHRARNPRVFGSVVRSEATRRSDIDLLVDFEDGASLFDQIGLQQDLERLFRRKVDVTTPEGLHWLVRPQVLFEAVPVRRAGADRS